MNHMANMSSEGKVDSSINRPANKPDNRVSPTPPARSDVSRAAHRSIPKMSGRNIIALSTATRPEKRLASRDDNR
jgi:hypothetical protein